jgi:flagellar motor switch protein FliG
MKFAHEVLTRAFGQDKAMSIIGRLTQVFTVRPFDIVRTADPDQLINFIQNEHPQTIALILAHLSAQQAAKIVKALPEGTQTEVAKKLALMDRTNPEIIREVERVLEKKLSVIMGEDYTAAGGVEAVVELLGYVDRGTEKSIIETLEIQDPELAEQIKKLMFVFDDLISIDDRGIQRLLREVDGKELSVALKGATDEVKEKLFGNMSKRAVAMLKEEMDFMGPVRVREVDEAQTKIVNIIRSLAENNEIIISRGGDEEMIL